MKKIILFVLILIYCSGIVAQNITNTLGSTGIFTIKVATNNYLTLSPTTGLNLFTTLRLENTTSSTVGVIYKGADRFVHNYGWSNIFMGINSGNFTLTGGNNTAIGNSTLNLNTTGDYNSAFGNYSLNNIISGYSNSAFGYQAATNNRFGIRNSAFGVQALYKGFSTDNNSAFGFHSLFNCETDANSAFGYESLNNTNFGYHNSAFGYQAGFHISDGIRNSAFGTFALSDVIIGSNNIGIGYNAQVPSGYLDNQVRIGNIQITYAGIQVAWTITSDKRWKQNILPVKLGLDFISKLNPVSYCRINDEKGKTEYGFIAQEIEEVLKEHNIHNSGMITITDDGLYELRYNDLLAPMVKAIQELKEENDRLKSVLESLKLVNEKIAQLEQLLLELKNKDNSIKEIKTSEK